LLSNLPSTFSEALPPPASTASFRPDQIDWALGKSEFLLSAVVNADDPVPARQEQVGEMRT